MIETNKLPKQIWDKEDVFLTKLTCDREGCEEEFSECWPFNGEAQVRGRSRTHGWRQEEGQDVCPICAETLRCSHCAFRSDGDIEGWQKLWTEEFRRYLFLCRECSFLKRGVGLHAGESIQNLEELRRNVK